LSPHNHHHLAIGRYTYEASFEFSSVGLILVFGGVMDPVTGRDGVTDGLYRRLRVLS